MMKAEIAVTATAAVVMSLLLAGCGGVEPEPVLELAEEDAPAEGERIESEIVPEPGAPGNSPSCLVGDWAADAEALQGYYTGILGAVDATISGVQGEYMVSFSETEYIISTSGIEFDMIVGGQGATAVMSGGAAGTYTAESGPTPSDPGIMSTRTDTADLDMLVTVAGIEFTSTELGIDMSGAFSGFDCSAAYLQLETQSGGPETALLLMVPAG